MKTILQLIITTLLAVTVTAQDAGTASKEVLNDAYPGKAYSPYAGRNFPDRVFWGDTHLHTSMSMDAGAFGNRLGLDWIG